MTGADARGMLDGREFVMESSTASTVDAGAPTRFRYSEDAGLVWGEYTGDTVTQGRFIGERVGATLTVQFIHALATDGSLVSGSSVSRIEAEGDAPLRLVEDFVIDGQAHVSVCVEVSG
jgi:hypothetical protein